MKSMLKQLLPKTIVNGYRQFQERFLDGFAVKSYAQEGEDLILRRIFDGRPSGFYVDIGAHHPQRFSNTHFFYKRGWNGLNVDALPGSMRAFEISRPRDINIEAPVSDTVGELTYFSFNEPALNGFSEELSLARDGKNGYRIIAKTIMATRTLTSILDEKLPPGMHIDFLTVDVEGLDGQVLRSNDWQKYRPDYVLAEALMDDLSDMESSELVIYMRSVGYAVFAKTVYTVFFKNRLQS